MNAFSQWDEVPLFDSEEAEASFWAENRPDLRLMESSVASSSESADSVTITLRIDPRMLSKIKRLARSRYLNYQSMIKQWLSERMEHETRENSGNISMNTATRFNPAATRRSGAFSLLELLVVITIIGLLAALVVGAARYAAEQKRIKRVQTDMAKWITMIDAYHAKLGFYPPGNINNPALSPLYYELCGMHQVGTDYFTLVSGDKVDGDAMNLAFGIKGFANSSTDRAEVRSFGTQIHYSDRCTNEVVYTNVVLITNYIKYLKVPADGVDAGGNKTDINSWYYNSANPVHNPQSYDLWAVYWAGNRLHTNGNWKE